MINLYKYCLYMYDNLLKIEPDEPEELWTFALLS